MKIAFCFLTHSNLAQPGVWDRFLQSAPAGTYNVYCHPKSPDAVTDPLLRNRIVAKLTATRHGHVSIVAATLNLFEAALEDDSENAYFLLISESAIPIVPFAGIADELFSQAGASWISYRLPEACTEHYFRASTLKDPARFAPFFYHDQWIILSRRHVERLIERPLLDHFDNVFAPDEHYFMNALVHATATPLGEINNRRTTFVNWNEREVRRYIDPSSGSLLGQTIHPKTYRSIDAESAAAARREQCWFFRKVSPECDCRMFCDDF